MKRIVVLSVLACSFIFCYGQLPNPISWKTEVKKVSETEYDLIFKATIQKKWALYSQYVAEGGPIPTTFTFEASSGYRLDGEVQELGQNREEKHDNTFNMKLIKFYNEVIFTQKVIVSDTTQGIKASVRFMSCDDTRCIPPKEEDFQFNF